MLIKCNRYEIEATEKRYINALIQCKGRWEKSYSNEYIIPTTGPLFTKKMPSYGDPHDKPKTVVRPSQVNNGNPYTDNTASS